jgi:hypothetical protein
MVAAAATVGENGNSTVSMCARTRRLTEVIDGSGADVSLAALHQIGEHS